MQETYNDWLSLLPSNGRIKRGLNLERKLTTISMPELLRFEARFWQYGFK